GSAAINALSPALHAVSIGGISSGDGSSASARSPSAMSRAPPRRRDVAARTDSSSAGTRLPTSARTGFQESVAAMSTDAASATMTHATNSPQIPAAPLGRPGGGADTPSASAAGSRAITPAKKIIHERSVRDSSRPNRRKACTPGTSGTSAAPGQPKKCTRGDARKLPTQPKLDSTPLPTRHVASASAQSAPPRKTANSNSAIPRISRFREELPTGYRSRSGPSLVI